jgi:hypothetical protein
MSSGKVGEKSNREQSITCPSSRTLTRGSYTSWISGTSAEKLDNNGNGPLYTVFLGAAIHGVAVVLPVPRFPASPTYPLIYTSGYRFTGSKVASNEDAFVVKLTEAPGSVKTQ